MKPNIYISKGVRKIPKPWHTDVLIDKNENKVYLSVVYADGDVKLLKISKAVAEILIARGMGYQG